MLNLKWLFKDLSKIDLQSLSDEDLLSLHKVVNKKRLKNASHLIRLLKMGIEFLTTGELQVHREDNSYLVDIKQGKYTLEQIKTEADRLFKVAEQAFINSKLPSKIDREKVEELLVKILKKEVLT